MGVSRLVSGAILRVRIILRSRGLGREEILLEARENLTPNPFPWWKGDKIQREGWWREPVGSRIDPQAGTPVPLILFYSGHHGRGRPCHYFFPSQKGRFLNLPLWVFQSLWFVRGFVRTFWRGEIFVDAHHCC